jgi:hypothetical protein
MLASFFSTFINKMITKLNEHVFQYLFYGKDMSIKYKLQINMRYI